MTNSLKIGNLEAKVPVIQGGMGVGISLGRLAGHVAACGGIGIISTAQIGFRDHDFDLHPFESNFAAIHEEVKKAREIAPEGIIGVNIMVATQRYEDYVKEAVSAGVDLIISGAGLPVGLPALVEGSDVKIAPIVSSVKSASVICKMWDRKHHRAPDMVVIEGPKAGGHLGFSGEELESITEEAYREEIRKIIALVKEYGAKYEKDIPVVVAGGIFDGADMRRALDLGADGVQVGTRFVTTEECDAGDAYKQAYIRAKKEDIHIIKSPVGMPGRAIYNTFIRNTEQTPVPIKKCHRCIITCKPGEIPYCITDALVNAVEGNLDEGLIFCGANAWRCARIERVADIMQELQNC